MWEKETQITYDEKKSKLREKTKRQILHTQEETRKTYNFRRRPASNYNRNDIVAIKRIVKPWSSVSNDVIHSKINIYLAKLCPSKRARRLHHLWCRPSMLYDIRRICILTVHYDLSDCVRRNIVCCLAQLLLVFRPPIKIICTKLPAIQTIECWLFWIWAAFRHYFYLFYFIYPSDFIYLYVTILYIKF